MITPRRVVIAVVAVVVFIFLFQLIPSSNQALKPVPVASDTQNDQVPDRSYPPPARQKQIPPQQVSVQDISTKPIRDKLRFYFPYDVDLRFPAFIWQTWKVSPSSGAFEERLRPKEATWTEKHPGFVHEVIVDDAAEHLVKYLYSSVPEVAEAYMSMPLPVLKADFFRYLILLARGGIYSDIDTDVIKPSVNWLPENFDQSTVGLIVGIEADPDRDDWNDWYARRIQFCQWTIQAKPGHPVLREIVAAITEKTLELKEKNQLVKGKEPTAVSVMEFTGPGIWTDSIFSYFNDKENSVEMDVARNVSVSDFFNMREHKRVGDVVVLPITSFSPGVGQMGAGEVDDPMAFVHHEFDGSWKPEKDRMKDF